MKLNPSQFVELVDSVFAEALAAFQLMPVDWHHHEDYFACRTFRSGDRYLQVSANCYFRDGQPECRVVLGHGPHHWPDVDWNAMALWRLNESGENYPFHSVEDIPSVLAVMRQDLLNTAEDFLAGDIVRFLKQRSAQNRQREPYVVHSPQPDGTYKATFEPESQKLKEKYSSEKKA